VKKSDFLSEADEDLSKDMLRHITTRISAIARPKQLYVVPELPKTRSGKIMRRVLRKIKCKEYQVMRKGNGEVSFEGLGDLTTMLDDRFDAFLYSV
jgi:acyl-coenzyme A synthetase/AMP-(fatty) acid ligase